MAFSPDDHQPLPANPLAKAIRDAAAKQSNTDEVASLSQSAEKVERIDRDLLQARQDLLSAIERAKVTAETLRKRDHLPTWVVVLVLLLFIAFLAHVATKHHV
jgi:hypothetical protein